MRPRRARATRPHSAETLEARQMLAVTFEVDTTLDAIETDPGDGVVDAENTSQTTLRAAVMEANATEGSDTIILGEGTFLFTIGGRKESQAATGDLDIRDDLRIVGAGRSKTIIDADALDRVFEVRPGVELILEGVTVRGGRSEQGENGGAIHNRGTLTIINSSISENRTGNGNEGKHYGDDGGSGGAIYNVGELTIEDSLIAKNFTGRGGDRSNEISAGGGGFGGHGGAIYNAGGSVRIIDSEIGDNSAGRGGSGGAGAYSGVGGFGGAIYNADGTILISDSRIEDNRAGDGGDHGQRDYGGDGGRGGGLYLAGGNVEIYTSRFSRNDVGYPGSANPDPTGEYYGGSGVGAVYTIALDFTQPYCEIAEAQLPDAEEEFAGATYDAIHTARHNRSGEAFEPNWETVGLAGDGGGIYTEHGSLTVRDTDFYRHRLVNDELDGDAFGGALYNEAADVSLFDAGFYSNVAGQSQAGAAIYNAGGTLQIEASNLVDNGRGSALVNAGGEVLAIRTNTSEDEEISFENLFGGLEIRGGVIGRESGGGLVNFDGSVLVEDARFRESNGRGVVNYSGTVELNQTTIAENRGGIRNDSGILILRDSDVSQNIGTSGMRGAGVYNRTGILTIENSRILGNEAGNGAPGGGLYNHGGEVTIDASTIAENKTGRTGGDGGGVYNLGGDLKISDSAIHGNVAGGSSGQCSIGASVRGGGLFAAGGEVAIERTTVSGNRIEQKNAEEREYYPDEDYDTFIENGNSGGGVFNAGAQITILDSTIYRNQTGAIGEIAASSQVDNRWLVLQDAFALRAPGAGIYQQSGTTTLGNSIVAGNDGGAESRDLIGSFVSLGHNLIGELGTAAGITPGESGDLAGSSTAPIDPRLATLADNGGPTVSHRPLAGSPAMDTGRLMGERPRTPVFNLATGLSNGSEGSDIGAVEAGPLGTEANDMAVEVFDLNSDGRVGFADLALLSAEFLRPVNSDHGRRVVDFNGDGHIGFDDLSLLSAHFLSESGRTAVERAPSVRALPWDASYGRSFEESIVEIVMLDLEDVLSDEAKQLRNHYLAGHASLTYDPLCGYASPEQHLAESNLVTGFSYADLIASANSVSASQSPLLAAAFVTPELPGETVDLSQYPGTPAWYAQLASSGWTLSNPGATTPLTGHPVFGTSLDDYWFNLTGMGSPNSVSEPTETLAGLFLPLLTRYRLGGFTIACYA